MSQNPFLDPDPGLRSEIAGASSGALLSSPCSAARPESSTPNEPPPPYTPPSSGSGAAGTPFYAPPPHPPSSNFSRAGSSSTRQAPIDLTPTSTPTPGRPLLNGGKVLHYKPGFWCPKCQNTGYKHDDPSHPCKTCWKKYGRAYTSAVATSWPRAPVIEGDCVEDGRIPRIPDSEYTGANNWQRPLRDFRRPQVSTSPPTSGYGLGGSPYSLPLPPQLQQQSSYGREKQSIPPPPPRPPANFNPVYWPPQPPPPAPPPPPMGPIIHTSYWAPPPPGAMVLQSGDPRIGGLLCPQCRGVGWIETFLGFDTETCRVCRGVGRVF